MRSTARAVYGKEPVTFPSGAATQPLHPIMSVLGGPVASAGIGYPDGRAHAPGEKLRLSGLVAGTKHVAAVIQGTAGRDGGVGEKKKKKKTKN